MELEIRVTELDLHNAWSKDIYAASNKQHLIKHFIKRNQERIFTTLKGREAKVPISHLVEKYVWASLG